MQKVRSANNPDDDLYEDGDELLEEEDETPGRRRRFTVCVSSQVGCAMRCSFCATGRQGFRRNLTSDEIVNQVLSMEDVFGRRATNVVMMGMGEPLLNLREVLRAHRCLNRDVGIGGRYFTISTVGVPNALSKLATHRLQATLAVSLHAPTQELRERLIPSAKAFPLDALLEEVRMYRKATGRRVTFEYTLLAGENDSEDHARALAKLLRSKVGRGCHINLLPWNPVAEQTTRDRRSLPSIASATYWPLSVGCHTPFVQRVVLWLKRRVGSSQGRLNASLPDRTR